MNHTATARYCVSGWVLKSTKDEFVDRIGLRAVFDSRLTKVQVGACDESLGLVRGHAGYPLSHTRVKGGVADLEYQREQVLPSLRQQMLQ